MSDEKLENGRSWIPEKAFFTLRDACMLKGLNYKTSCNRTNLQPNGGKPDGFLGGRKVFSRSTILAWINLLDDAVVDGIETPQPCQLRENKK